MRHEEDDFSPDHRRIILPGQDDLDAIGTNICGTCKYFSLAEGQKRMQAQRFVEVLVREHKWKLHHLCSPLNQLGLCGAHESGERGGESLITGSQHKACDHYRPKK